VSKSDALAFIDEAIDALTIQAWRGQDVDNMVRVPPLEATIAIELDRVDCAIGPKGKSMFAPLADNVKQAMAALHGARNAIAQDLDNG